MNTIEDLQTELRALAADAPTDQQVRTVVGERIAARTRRRRAISVIAAAAAVLVVGAGAAIVSGVFADRAPGPAVQHPVVPVPEVPLPPDTALVRHDLPTVVSPVTNSVPGGLDAMAWSSAPGRLAVSWYNGEQMAAGFGGLGWAATAVLVPDDSEQPGAAGYLVTDTETLALTASGPQGIYQPDTERTTITVGGHPAELVTAPDDATDEMGLPAARRITWQLTDGRWIHVWASGRPAALETFAGTFIETPETLYRSVGVGLTLPGLTNDWSINPTVVAVNSMSSLTLCPVGIDPYAGVSADGNSRTTGLGPGGTSPVDPCLQVTVTIARAEQLEPSGATEVDVDGTIVFLSESFGAWTDLGSGVFAFVKGPVEPALSDADLAAVAASVRLAPHLAIRTATPEPLPAGDYQSDQASASEAGPTTAAVAIPSPAPGEDEARAALDGYLRALVAGDCERAATWTVDSFADTGQLCGSVAVTDYSEPTGPAAFDDGVIGYEVELTTDGSRDGSVAAGASWWSYTLEQQPDGRWLLARAESGR